MPTVSCLSENTASWGGRRATRGFPPPSACPSPLGGLWQTATRGREHLCRSTVPRPRCPLPVPVPFSLPPPSPACSEAGLGCARGRIPKLPGEADEHGQARNAAADFPSPSGAGGALLTCPLVPAALMPILILSPRGLSGAVRPSGRAEEELRLPDSPEQAAAARESGPRGATAQPGAIRAGAGVAAAQPCQGCRLHQASFCY